MASRILSMPSNSYTGLNSYKFPGAPPSSQQQSQQNQQNTPSTVSSTSSNSSIDSACSSSNNNTSNTNSLIQKFNKTTISSSSLTSTGSLPSTTGTKWNVGLMNSEGKYLTAENFNCKVNATGNSLRKKQKWQLEQESCGVGDQESSLSVVYLISPLGYYLSTDKYGKISCDKTESGGAKQDDECKFLLETNAHDGKWAFRSALYGYYFGGKGDQLHCFSKVPDWWTIHLAIHPQINLRHALRKRYARMEDDEIYVDELIPWGSDCLITIEFRDSQYAIRTSNGMYLSRDGKLVTLPTPDTLFHIELHKGCVAFRHACGKYLTAVGPQGIVTARSKSVTKDELFVFDPNHAQVSLQSAFNGKMVSVKQGLDVSANQIELSNTETFQLEEDAQNEKWTLRTNKNKYWKLEQSNSIQSTGEYKHPNCFFDIVWARAGYVVLRATNGKYVTCSATGHMKAVSDSIGEPELFRISLVNRPILVLKCDYGLVGYKNKTGYKLECNKSTFNVILLEEWSALLNANEPDEQQQQEQSVRNDGYYCLKGSHGLYWDIGSDNTLSANSSHPTRFSIELMPSNRMIIKGPNGFYLKGEQNGSLTCSNITDPKLATQWEF